MRIFSINFKRVSRGNWIGEKLLKGVNARHKREKALEQKGGSEIKFLGETAFFVCTCWFLWQRGHLLLFLSYRLKTIASTLSLSHPVTKMASLGKRECDQSYIGSQGVRIRVYQGALYTLMEIYLLLFQVWMTVCVFSI